jgi:phosphotransferase system enzyme I (PtsI)
MTPSARRPRTVLSGIAASHGIAVGKARLFGRSLLRVPRRRIRPEDAPLEVVRLREAIDASRREIEDARAVLGAHADADYQLVLDAHLLMHGDALLVDTTVETIEREHLCAEWALRRTVESLSSQLSASESEYFRARAADVNQVGLHILRSLTGDRITLPVLDEPVVLVTDDLSPAEAARLAESPLLALVTEHGSASSHTAIVARALGIPALVGVPSATDHIGDGDRVVVDALRGEVVLCADEGERDEALERSRRYRAFTAGLRSRAEEQARTADGARVVLAANLEIPAEAAAAAGPESGGIGLYRTEFLYLGRDQAPTEEEQRAIYADVLAMMKPRPVTFRTFDLGADKLPTDRRFPRGPNPALGLRGVRLLMTHPRLFRAQIRAVLRAAAEGNARLMFPLVGSLADLRGARALVEEVITELEAEGVEHARVPVGVMIEVPAAALLAEALAEECDFFSVGTNDLIQYTFALDRTNPRVATLAESLDPALLKLLAMTAEAASDRDIDLSMCGDMASDPFALPIVIGLGFRSLSMPTTAIPLANAIVRRIDAKEAEAAAREALDLSDARRVHELIRARFSDALSDLWAEEGIG